MQPQWWLHAWPHNGTSHLYGGTGKFRSPHLQSANVIRAQISHLPNVGQSTRECAGAARATRSKRPEAPSVTDLVYGPLRGASTSDLSEYTMSAESCQSTLQPEREAGAPSIYAIRPPEMTLSSKNRAEPAANQHAVPTHAPQHPTHGCPRSTPGGGHRRQSSSSPRTPHIRNRPFFPKRMASEITDPLNLGAESSLAEEA